MKQPIEDNERIADVLGWIENHLDDTLTLDGIAARAGLSPHHFSRLFATRLRRSVMAHVRGRRLVRAAQRLLNDPKARLIDLALDCGFNSQESFTRAFRRMYGTSPGRVQRTTALAPHQGLEPIEMEDVAVSRVPDLIALDAFTVAGPSRRFDKATKAEIPDLWSRLIGSLPLPGQEPSWATYGIVWDVDRSAGRFQYMAGVRVKPECPAPDGFASIAIPAARYVRFRITLNGGALHPQMSAAMARIWGELVPATGLAIANSPHFETYEGKFAPNRPGASIDFHLPVEGDVAT